MASHIHQKGGGGGTTLDGENIPVFPKTLILERELKNKKKVIRPDNFVIAGVLEVYSKDHTKAVTLLYGEKVQMNKSHSGTYLSLLSGT